MTDAFIVLVAAVVAAVILVHELVERRRRSTVRTTLPEPAMDLRYGCCVDCDGPTLIVRDSAGRAVAIDQPAAEPGLNTTMTLDDRCSRCGSRSVFRPGHRLPAHVEHSIERQAGRKGVVDRAMKRVARATRDAQRARATTTESRRVN